MSSLTKVFVLLVSLLAIFLCGVVVTFVANTENYRELYEQQQSVTQAAQVQTVAVEEEWKKWKDRYEILLEKKDENLRKLLDEVARMTQELSTERQGRAEALSQANTAVSTMQALQQTVQNMYEGQNAVQTELNKAHEEMITARSQVINLTRSLNSEKAKTDQLESIRREYEEKVAQLEDENQEIRRKLQQVTVSPSEMRKGMDQVSQAAPEVSGVPIRGQITEIDEELASISVGSSSGVRRDMIFHVARGDQYLGDLQITHVEPGESVGQLVRKQGVIVPGDAVSTGFN